MSIAALLMHDAFAVGDAIFKGFLGIVPSAAAARHSDGLEEAGDDAADEQAAEGLTAEEQAHDHWHNHRNEGRDHHLLDGALGHDVHALAILGLCLAFHDALDLTELPAHFLDDAACSLTHGFH